MRRILLLAGLLLLPAASVHGAKASVSLNGSRASMERQNRIARELDYSFLRTDRQVEKFAEAGRLVPLAGGADYAVLASYPYARPVVREFIERLAAEYHAGCGEKLVVTSLTRPAQKQPRNASPLSVHPAGMAVDLRVSQRIDCVGLLQNRLLALEDAGVLDATREFRPPHFLIAVFPEQYAGFAQTWVADSSARAAATFADSVRRAQENAARAALGPVPQLVPGTHEGPVRRLLSALLSLAAFVLPV
jgi:hypothetical protein